MVGGKIRMIFQNYLTDLLSTYTLFKSSNRYPYFPNGHSYYYVGMYVNTGHSTLIHVVLFKQS